MAKKASATVPVPPPAAPQPEKIASDHISKVMDLLQEHSVEYVDLRFTDPKGKWHHTIKSKNVPPS